MKIMTEEQSKKLTSENFIRTFTNGYNEIEIWKGEKGKRIYTFGNFIFSGIKDVKEKLNRWGKSY